MYRSDVSSNSRSVLKSTTVQPANSGVSSRRARSITPSTRLPSSRVSMTGVSRRRLPFPALAALRRMGCLSTRPIVAIAADISSPVAPTMLPWTAAAASTAGASALRSIDARSACTSAPKRRPPGRSLSPRSTCSTLTPGPAPEPFPSLIPPAALRAAERTSDVTVWTDSDGLEAFASSASRPVFHAA